MARAPARRRHHHVNRALMLSFACSHEPHIRHPNNSCASSVRESALPHPHSNILFVLGPISFLIAHATQTLCHSPHSSHQNVAPLPHSRCQAPGRYCPTRLHPAFTTSLELKPASLTSFSTCSPLPFFASADICPTLLPATSNATFHHNHPPHLRHTTTCPPTTS